MLLCDIKLKYDTLSGITIGIMLLLFQHFEMPVENLTFCRKRYDFKNPTFLVDLNMYFTVPIQFLLMPITLFTVKDFY